LACSELRVRIGVGPPGALRTSRRPAVTHGTEGGLTKRCTMENAFRPVSPTRPAAAYIGGKKRLAAELARRIESVPHATYAEPFVGMGGVFFRRAWIPKCEVINDISRDVATLFRILQRHYPQFMDTLKFPVLWRKRHKPF
jgi:hypothetical protein